MWVDFLVLKLGLKLSVCDNMGRNMPFSCVLTSQSHIQNARDGFIPSGALLKAMLVHSTVAVTAIVNQGAANSLSIGTPAGYPSNQQVRILSILGILGMLCILILNITLVASSIGLHSILYVCFSSDMIVCLCLRLMFMICIQICIHICELLLYQ